MKKIVLSVLLVALCLPVFAQEAATTFKNRFQFDVGYTKTYFKDINFSPLNYQANALAIGLGYARISDKKHQTFFQLRASPQGIKSSASTAFRSDRYLANITLGHLRNVPLANEKWQLHIGGEASAHLSLVFWNGTNSFTYYGLYSADVTGQIAYSFDEQKKIYTALSLPLVGLFARPPYAGLSQYISDNQTTPIKIVTNGNWTSLNDFLGLHWTLGYQYDWSEKWAIRLQNDFFHYQTKHRHFNKNFDNLTTLGLQKKF